ncbi:transposase [Paraburkholderia caballeronis]|uniref:Transposase n=1 Tax=Paraburkholderia caballeronis TaxID=416943 RepID=A0A1H7S0Z5_9BURK|nr:transposase [Paraburkholderia caballeronis]PXW22819.1 transposase [Paraburkholderia caballeronis]PXW97204.1 transposase [Paraburkholderia caballeronis]RAJ93724.1 transposase [Paraburkholderia caballeronis]SED61914.1 Transposase [Paraburkholderia caballeronis]SEL65939.1 Transposase [Paraburkholderia caballeronis]
MNFEELSDDEWMQIAALVSDEPPIRLNRRGRPRAEPRVVANAVLWILTTGESWSRLPARYPSGPTCRRRFDEWHASGTLVELVQLLSQRGRTFVYVPEADPPAPRPLVEIEEPAEDDGLPSVFWKSPEAWQAPSREDGDVLHEAPLANPMESITRQLANVAPERVGDAGGARAPAVQPQRAYPARAPREDHPVAARSAALWMTGGDQSVQMAEWRGYAMNLTVQPVRNRMFRASVEILKDGQRVERSGLVGPPFNDREIAKQYAFDWGRQWIERDGPSSPGQGHAQRRDAGANVVTRAAANVVTRPAPPAGVAAPQRIAPLHRYPSQGGLPATLADNPESGSTNGNGASAERRTVAPRLRTTHAG